MRKYQDLCTSSGQNSDSVTLICGEKEGETVLISGGVHNAEYVGIQAAMQLADELDPKKIAGNTL